MYRRQPSAGFLLGLILLPLVSASSFAQEAPYLYVLGVVQDAGHPQIGCYAEHCQPGWRDASLRRGATALGLIDPSANKTFLFEATPNMPAQLYQLAQEAPLDRYALGGIFLTHAQLVTQQNILLQAMAADTPVTLGQVTVTPFLVPHRDEYSETVGYRITGPNKSALFIPDINKWSAWTRDITELVQTVDYALVDATFYADDELPGRDMSKIPHPFAAETMALFKGLALAQRQKIWFIHMNHTNPLLNASSKESDLVRSRGFNIAEEGIRLNL